MIYAVVKYPKTFSPQHGDGEVHVYSKQTSNKEIMIEYYKEIKAKYGDNYYVHLMSREEAKRMEKEISRKMATIKEEFWRNRIAQYQRGR